MEGFKIADVILILVKTDREKSAGSGGIVIEMQLALDDLSINKITEILNEICNLGANECELHLTTSIMIYQN